MSTKLSQILEESGIPLSFQPGGNVPHAKAEREEQRQPYPRAKRLLDLYYHSFSSATNKFPNWYPRTCLGLDVEVLVLRRALALKCAFSHLIPALYPSELIIRFPIFPDSMKMRRISTRRLSLSKDRIGKN